MINPAIVVTPATLPNATQNQFNYSQTLGTTGGTGAKTFAVTSGNLPTGMNLNSTTGILSGTPTVANTFNFTVTATDSVGATGVKDYTIVVAGPVNITTATLSNWTQNFAGYSQQVAATGGTGALTYTIASGSLPTGLNLNPANGTVAGTPTDVGTFAFTIRATDPLGAFAAQNFAVTISTPLNITPTTLPGGFKSQQYQQFILASGGTGTHVMSLSNVVNNFANIGINIIGDIVQVLGMSDVPGAISFTVTATDTVGATSSRNYTVNFV
ncbi:MAG: Ig domain-containing protein [Planctomycetota bacterium]|nr:Ig domain-containing protein [Planctomycetota bacterium]